MRVAALCMLKCSTNRDTGGRPPCYIQVRSVDGIRSMRQYCYHCSKSRCLRARPFLLLSTAVCFIDVSRKAVIDMYLGLFKSLAHLSKLRLRLRAPSELRTCTFLLPALLDTLDPHFSHPVDFTYHLCSGPFDPFPLTIKVAASPPPSTLLSLYQRSFTQDTTQP